MLLTAAGCYGLKLSGWLIPPRLLGARLRRAVGLLPVALLSALVVVQALSAGQALVIDARAIGLAAAAAALLLRAPFLVVVLVAAAAAATVRALS